MSDVASTSELVNRRFGTAGLMGFDSKVRELIASGYSKKNAELAAQDWLQTCSRCGNRVTLKKRPDNRRQRSDGGLDHVQCSPEPAEDER